MLMHRAELRAEVNKQLPQELEAVLAQEGVEVAQTVEEMEEDSFFVGFG